MLLKQVFKNNSTLNNTKFIASSKIFHPSSKRSQIIVNNKFANKTFLNRSNHFSFSKVSHLINPFTKKPVSDRPYISDEAIV